MHERRGIGAYASALGVAVGVREGPPLTMPISNDLVRPLDGRAPVVQVAQPLNGLLNAAVQAGKLLILQGILLRDRRL